MIELTREDILRGAVDVPVETLAGEGRTIRITRLRRREVEALAGDDMMEQVLLKSVPADTDLDGLTFESAADLKKAAWVLSVAGWSGQKKAQEAAMAAAAAASSNCSAPSAS